MGSLVIWLVGLPLFAVVAITGYVKGVWRKVFRQGQHK